jgi:hypothetical protein
VGRDDQHVDLAAGADARLPAVHAAIFVQCRCCAVDLGRAPA